ncbi:MAG: HNH endonuclease signature motif containing protein [Candidatus Poribacteria bacterium]|nr:HNH endonuclease signature motif containing protein [Candidatus Poribacteria bacterium]
MTDYQKYMRSKEWKAKRQEKLEACDHKCECEGGCYRKATQIHHLHYDTLGDESMEDLQALCPKCHMQKSRVKGFYGRVPLYCCQTEPIDESRIPKKILPYSVWHEANFWYHLKPDRYENIANELGADPLIISLLDNLGILFACGKIAVTPKTTKAIEAYADVVPASEAALEGYCDTAYRIKPEFQKYFPSDEYDE